MIVSATPADAPELRIADFTGALEEIVEGSSLPALLAFSLGHRPRRQRLHP